MKNNLSKIKESFDQVATLENFGLGIVFFLPFYLIKIDYFGLPTNLLEVLMLIFLVLFFANKKNWSKLKKFTQENKKYVWGFGFLLFGLFFSTVLNENISKGLGIIKGWFVLPFLFSLTLTSLLEKEKRLNIFKAYFFSALGLALLSLAFLFSGHLTFDHRLKGIFNSPNYLAMYLAPALIIGFFIFKKGYKLKYFFWAILLAVLFSTYSYLAWLAMGGTIIGIGLTAQKRALKKVFWGMLMVVGLFLLLTLRTEKMQDLLNLNSRSSVASRVMIWRSAGQILKDNWLFGIGPSNFQTRYLAKQKDYPPYLEWAVPHPHSLYLTMWLSAGLVGFLAFMGMLFWWLKDFVKHKKRETILGIISLSIVLYFLLHGLADTTYFKNDLAVIFWLAFLSLL